MKNRLKTLKEWNNLGYKVIKGERATAFLGKDALFTERQVEPYCEEFDVETEQELWEIFGEHIF